MKNMTLVFWLALLVSLPTAYAGYLAWQKMSMSPEITASSTEASDADERGRTAIASGGPTIPAFKLTAQTGKEFDSRSMIGHVWVASYFYASCPGPCYKLNQALAAFQGETALDSVKFVSITCDPSNDTAEVLSRYAERFAADPKRWCFLTGDEKEVAKVGTDSFAIPVAVRTHSDLAVVLDRRSAIRGFFHLSDETDVRRMHKRLGELLVEKTDPANDSAAPDTAKRTGNNREIPKN